jgi:hypothetical protein
MCASQQEDRTEFSQRFERFVNQNFIGSAFLRFQWFRKSWIEPHRAAWHQHLTLPREDKAS